MEKGFFYVPFNHEFCRFPLPISFKINILPKFLVDNFTYLVILVKFTPDEAD
jgi:hypothetical protein